MRLRKFIGPGLIGAGTGLAMALAFPGGPFPWLAWVLYVPLMIGFFSWDTRQCTVAWFVYAYCGCGACTIWLMNYLQAIFHMSLPVSMLLLGVMQVMYAIPYVIGAYFAARWKWPDKPFFAFKFAALLVFLCEFIPTPFSGDVALSQYRVPIVIQIADLGGGVLILFVILFVNALIAQFCYAWFSQKQVLKGVAVTLVATIVGMLGYGSYRLSEYRELDESADPSQKVRIGYIQQNIQGADLRSIYGEYLDLDQWDNNLGTTFKEANLLASTNDDLDFIVIPESPDAFPYHRDRSIRDAFKEVVDKAKAPLVFVDIDPWVGYSDLSYMTGHSSLYYLDTEGELTFPYRKTRLIPFAEYLPGERQFPILREFFPQINDLTHGEGAGVLEVNERLMVIPFICYEGIFADYAREGARMGGNVFVSLDNDVNFGPTRAPEIHLASMLYRAIENRLPLVRINNSGVSATILASGEILAGSETPLYQRSHGVVEIKAGSISQPTVYQQVGYLASPLLLLFALLLGFFNRFY